MIYVKGGAAWAHDKYNFSGQATNNACEVPAPMTCTLFFPIAFSPTLGTNPFNFNASETRVGWTVGGGLEWAFWGNWTAKLEYDFLDFGTRNVTFTSTRAQIDGATFSTFGPQTIGVRQRISEVKLGLNYLFNYGPH